jgi:hypothetical protein
MHIPDEMRKCVVFVGYRNHDGMYKLGGTAFYTERTSEDSKVAFRYLVTAKHVIDEIRDKHADKVCLRVNLGSGKAKWIETDINDWRTHPDDSEEVVDVAVYVDDTLSPEFDHISLNQSMYISQASQNAFTRPEIGIGREVFLTGLFESHHGQDRNIPIIRVGNIAAMPEEKVQTGLGFMDAYLIEARSLGGISGSPVFVNVPHISAYSFGQHLGAYDAPFISASSKDEFYLLGLMHGHWDLGSDADADATTIEDVEGRKSVNMGIAIVVPDSKILEVIGHPLIKQREKEIEDRERKKNLLRPDGLSEPTVKG